MKRALALAAIAVAACGSSSPTDEVRSTVTDYYRAFANADGAGACSKLSVATRQTLERAAHGRSCAAALTQAAHERTFAQVRSRLGQARVSAIKVNGDHATAEVSLGRIHVPVALVKEGGDWKVESSAAAGH